MNEAINGRVINGANAASWVVQGMANATAGSAVVSCRPTRITYGRARGDAAVTVTLAPEQTIYGRATGVATATASASPTQVHFGSAKAVARGAGYAAVLRQVWGQASADARCYAEVLLAQAIGQAQATAHGTVVLALGHVVHPGRARAKAGATGRAAGDVTRYAATAPDTLGHACNSWGEASIRRKGEAHFLHDGYVQTTARSTAHIDPARTHVSVTYGVFDFAQSDAKAMGFMVYSARGSGVARSFALPAVGNNVLYAQAEAQATASGQAEGVRVCMAQAQGVGRSAFSGLSARTRHAGAALALARGEVVATQATRRVIVRRNEAKARAFLAHPLVYGRQHWGQMTPATGRSKLVAAVANVHYQAASVPAVGQASVERCVGHLVIQGFVNDAIATALWGRAYALLNSDVRAPDERYMLLPPEDRGMLVAAQDRVMVTV